MNDDQAQVAAFTEQQQLETTLTARALDLVSEVGELSKEVLLSTRYGKQPFCATENWQAELGDVYFSLLCLANSSGIDLSQTLQHTLEKYQTRIVRKGDAGSGEAGQ